MDDDLYVVPRIRNGRLKGIHLDILSEEDSDKLSVLVIGSPNEVSDAQLGQPTTNGSECLTCGGKSSRDCEGHFGLIKFPFTILNPYFMSEISQILNKICPGCKCIRNSKKKAANSSSKHPQPERCKYCTGYGNNGYPRMIFKVSSKDVFAKTAITAEAEEKSVEESSPWKLASDYWNVIPSDSALEQNGSQSNKRALSPAQVYSLLKDVERTTLELVLNKRKNKIFLNSLLVTPNSHRLIEFGHRISFDETTKMYKKLVDFGGSPNELSVRVLERYKVSKLRSEKVSAIEKEYEKQSTNDSASSSSGLKNMKELLLSKRTDNCFRMVVVGDSRIKIDEIGLPVPVAKNMLISDHINSWNWDKLEAYCDFMLNQKGDLSVFRNGRRIRVGSKEMLEKGDSIYRPLIDGDIVLINRPPSIHQHSLIALSVKILPINSVVSINPLICSPFRGDFDGDCLHGFIPQSVNTRVELKELVSLKHQLVNGQSGQNLLSLSQDSLTAAYLILEDGIFLKKSEMQQLQMCCSPLPILPAVMKSSASSDTPLWTGKQMFSLLLPRDFDFHFPSDGVHIRDGEIVSARDGSAWLRDSSDNLFQFILRHCQEETLDFLYSAQEVLCEWLTRRGFSVSLLDLCLSSDPESRKDLTDDVSLALEEVAKLSDISLLMVDSNLNFLMESSEEHESMFNIMKDQLYIARQTSPELFQASVSASKSVFRNMQNLVYKYAGNNNSLMAMMKAGSKGNLQKLVQHSMCLGLQHSLSPLSFLLPHNLSCAAWNDQKNHRTVHSSHKSQDTYIPCTVVANSYLAGLNPLECYVHSLVSRDSSFSGHADVSGTLTRRLMYFMRDLIVGYDGTVRSCHGNQVIQFNYCPEGISNAQGDVPMGGHPVGSLAACAISEATYSALDLPVSALEPSPLLSLKKVLECGVKKNTGSKSASLFLSNKLGRWANGFEYGALEVKHHLESLLFSDIVSEVAICHSRRKNSKTCTAPWICHFHVNKEVAKKRRLKPHSIVRALNRNCNRTGVKWKLNLPNLVIEDNVCCEADVDEKSDSRFCISVALKAYGGSISELDTGSVKRFQGSTDKRDVKFSELETLRVVVVPILLQTVVKGFPEFKNVDILWRDENNSKFPKRSSGELFLRVIMSEYCDRTKFWSILQESCLRIRNIIDWDCSHPDDIQDYSEAYGIDAAWQCFVKNLNCAITDTGKTILPEHLIVTADCLTATGEFVALNAKGLTNQRKEVNVFSPFVQACFSNPGDCLVKAAKMGQTDGLLGSLDALAWGQTPPIGTGCKFDIICSGKGHELAKPTDVYSLLSTHAGRVKPNDEKKLPVKPISSKSFGLFHYLKTNGRKNLCLDLDGINRISRALKHMLKEYAINCNLSGEDKSIAMMALQFHPRRKEKIGSGAFEIKIGRHPNHKERCFFLVRTDGTEEDFSYHKCLHHALEVIAPRKAMAYMSKHLNGKTIL